MYTNILRVGSVYKQWVYIYCMYMYVYRPRNVYINRCPELPEPVVVLLMHFFQRQRVLFTQMRHAALRASSAALARAPAPAAASA